MGSSITDYDLDADIDKARTIRTAMSEGIKVLTSDLRWYLDVYLGSNFHDTWRHKETDTVYKYAGLGLACDGEGHLTVMVHYVPVGEAGPVFERVHAYFVEKFEPVYATTVWVNR